MEHRGRLMRQPLLVPGAGGFHSSQSFIQPHHEPSFQNSSWCHCILVSGRFQGNGHEEVVACAWDGQTYIIDHNRTVVRFQVDENIRAFCAGGPPPRAPAPSAASPLALRPLMQVCVSK